MKPIFILLLLAVLSTGCGVNSGLVNQLTLYGNNTNAVLEKNNFKVIGEVTGTASDNYIFGIGGFKTNLVSKAKKDMLTNASLNGSSRTVVNLSLERHRSTFLGLFGTHTITVHGTLIEFDK